MDFQTQYVAKKPDEKGVVAYTAEENAVWRDLYARQIKVVPNRACDEYLHGLEILNMPQDRIPQLSEINQGLHQTTGWTVAPVAALIGFDEFFGLLADKRFPAATFIRSREDFDYITEPDIFHEYFGHCPMLTEPVYANFMQTYGEIGKNANHQEQVLLARLYWFTVEFGLIKTAKGLRIYGGGILSSPEETRYALESNIPERKDFNPIDALRTPYRIDIKQPIYFVIDKYQELYDLTQNNLLKLVHQAAELGEFEPKFPLVHKEKH